jgi:hypothetical protein
MALPIHIFVIASNKKWKSRDSRKPLVALKDKHPLSLEGIVSNETYTTEGKIVKARVRDIDYDAPSGSGYYQFAYLWLKDKEKRVHKLVYPLTNPAYNLIERYTGRKTRLKYNKLINGRISSQHFVENFIWPTTNYKVYPVLKNIKGNGIVIGDIEFNKFI